MRRSYTLPPGEEAVVATFCEDDTWYWLCNCGRRSGGRYCEKNAQMGAAAHLRWHEATRAARERGIGGCMQRVDFVLGAFRGKVLFFEDRIRIVRDGANEESGEGLVVTVDEGTLKAAEFTAPPTEEAAPAAAEPPAPPVEV